MLHVTGVPMLAKAADVHMRQSELVYVAVVTAASKASVCRAMSASHDVAE